MSIFGTIMSKIFGSGDSSAAPAAATSSTASPTATPSAAMAASSAPAGQPSSPETKPTVDVEAVLTQMASASGGGGNWKTSIVDLLKLLDLDSSLNARKELANELNVHAGADGSAEKNVALHKAVMQKLAENGGKVPEFMKD